jgi:hypothetical protein
MKYSLKSQPEKQKPDGPIHFVSCELGHANRYTVQTETVK